MSSLDLYRYSVLLKRLLSRLEDSYHAQSVMRIGERRGSGPDTIDKVLAFKLEWLHCLDARNQNIPETYLNCLSKGADRRHFSVIVVDSQFLRGFGVIKDRHFVAAHDRSAPHLVRIQPT